MNKKDVTRGYLNTFVRASIFAFFSLALSKGFTYIYKIVIARNFGAEAYGNFSLATIIIGLFIALASLGLSDGLVRYFSYYLGKKDLGRVRYFFVTSSRLMLISGIIGALLLFFLAEFIGIGMFHNQQLVAFLKIFSIIVPLSLFGSMGVSFLRAYERANTASFTVGIFHNGIRLIFIGALIALGVGLYSLPYSYVLSYLSVVLLVLFFTRKDIVTVIRTPQRLTQRERDKMDKELFHYSWPLVFTGLLFSLFYWIDSLVLGYYTSSEIVGFYSAAVTLGGLFIMAPDLFSQLFLPIISKELSRNNKDVIRALTKQVAKWIYMANIFLFGVMFFFPGALLNLFFGPEFMVAQTPLRILALGGIFSGFVNPLTSLLSAKKKTKLVLYNFAAFSAVNLGLNLLLIRYEMIGVATATSLSWIGFYLALFVETKKTYGFYPIKRNVIRVTLAALAPLTFLYLFSHWFGQSRKMLIIGSVSAGVMYLVLLIITKSLDERDLSIVQDVKSKVIRGASPVFRLNGDP